VTLPSQARSLAEAVLLPLTGGPVNLHPAVPLARAVLAALDAEPRIDRVAVERFIAGWFITHYRIAYDTLGNERARADANEAIADAARAYVEAKGTADELVESETSTSMDPVWDAVEMMRNAYAALVAAVGADRA
jgi:glucokinase